MPHQLLSIRFLTLPQQSTERRSALRIQRESELLGSELQASHSRENLVVGAKFLRDDLPYFVELLAEVATRTKYLGMLQRTRHTLYGEHNIDLAQATFTTRRLTQLST